MEGDDAKTIVAKGYDQIVDAYLERFGRSTVRAKKFAELIEGLPRGAKVLDLGCGAGVPVVRALIKLGFDVTGVDSSIRQIERARQSAPQAKFIRADMTKVQFRAESFDAVSAFYSISHVPRAEHAELLKRIAGWLRPGGRFLASFGNADGEWSGEWLGTSMFFSHHDPDVTKQLVLAAGLQLEDSETLKQDNEAAEFLWLTGRKQCSAFTRCAAGD